MSLCNVCRSLPFRRFVTDVDEWDKTLERDGFRFNALGRRSPPTSDEMPRYTRRCTIAEIVSRAKKCSFCAYILLKIKQHQWVDSAGSPFTWDELKTHIPRNPMIWMDLPRGLGYLGWFEIYLGNPQRRRSSYALYLHLRLDFESPLYKSLTIDPVCFRETVHPKTLQRVLSWLDTCNSSHSGCSHLATQLVPLPTRLLDVSVLPARDRMSGDYEAWRSQFQGYSCKVLQTSKGQTGRYATLSYCWGTSLPLTTTMSNLADHESGIGFHKLPRTLQDAVMMIRFLGIGHIWVDCLCIVQDSKADWAHEAAHMADVYSNAYLTIAASRATHCEEGFLGPRDMPSPFRIDVEDEEGSFELYLEERQDHKMQREPLQSRGWAAQESLLSHRVLSFGSRKMNWKCIHLDESENEKDPKSWMNTQHGNRVELMAEALRKPPVVEFWYNPWFVFTRDFSLREMTYETDTFPAMAGIVQRIQELTGDTYYAGIWKSHFLVGLGWHASPSRRPVLTKSKPYKFETGLLTRRPSDIAPSWSWASVKGDIEYNYAWGNTVFCAHVEECTIARTYLHPFSAPIAGFVRITGPVTLITDVGYDLWWGVPLCKLQLRNGALAIAQAKFDFVQRESCSVLMVTTHMGICIEKVEQTTDTYVRVGTVGVKREYEGMIQSEPDLTASDHVPPRTVTLI